MKQAPKPHLHPHPSHCWPGSVIGSGHEGRPVRTFGGGCGCGNGMGENEGQGERLWRWREGRTQRWAEGMPGRGVGGCMLGAVGLLHFLWVHQLHAAGVGEGLLCT